MTREEKLAKAKALIEQAIELCDSAGAHLPANYIHLALEQLNNSPVADVVRDNAPSSDRLN